MVSLRCGLCVMPWWKIERMGRICDKHTPTGIHERRTAKKQRFRRAVLGAFRAPCGCGAEKDMRTPSTAVYSSETASETQSRMLYHVETLLAGLPSSIC